MPDSLTQTLPVIPDEWADILFGVTDDQTPVHVRVPGTLIAYCGVRLSEATHLPPAEVTDPSWCPECVEVQDGE